MSVDDQIVKSSGNTATVSKAIQHQNESQLNKKQVDKQKIISIGLSVLETEATAIRNLAPQIDDKFVLACQIILNCSGRVVVTGIGKSGHIGRKIAATLASTGTPSFFLHPAEALHGDFGMVTEQDVVLALSHSGETEEIITLLPLIKRLNIPIITLTGNKESTLASLASVNLNVAVHQEACPLGLAPTSSTTAALAMGDALALALIEARGFTANDFAKSHPGGRLGRRLLLKIEDIMHKGDAVPKVLESAFLAEAIIVMTQKRLGFTAIVSVEDSETLIGIFTDGDLRRVIERNLDLHRTPINEVMTRKCKTISTGTLAVEAITIMEKPPLSFVLPVLEDKSNKLVGALNMHDIFKAGVL